MHDNTLEVYFPKCPKPVLIDIEDWPKVSRLSWYFTGSYIKSTAVGTNHLHNIILNPANNTNEKFTEIDHINRKKLDNRKSNLRFCSRSLNSANKPKVSFKTSSKYKGVSWHKQCWKWHAYIKKNGKRYSLGLFTEEFEAALAYDNKAKEFFGEFALTNYKIV